MAAVDTFSCFKGDLYIGLHKCVIGAASIEESSGVGSPAQGDGGKVKVLFDNQGRYSCAEVCDSYSVLFLVSGLGSQDTVG